MKGFVGDIELMAKKNSDFRHVLYTGENLQLVLMTIASKDEIGEEIHFDRDQFFRIESGEGEIWIDGNCTEVKDDDAIVVPARARHNLINTGNKPLKLYTIYGPPEHRDQVVQATKADAEAEEEHFDGVTSEVEMGPDAETVVS